MPWLLCLSECVKCEKTIEGYNLRIDELAARIEVLEKTVGSSSTLDTLRVEGSTLRAEVVQIQSMDISTLWGDVSLSVVAAPAPEIPNVAPSSFVPEVVVDEDAMDEELAEETDEEGLREDKHGIAETLAELHETDEIIIQATPERSLQETSVVGSNGVTPDSPTLSISETGNDAQVELSLLPPMILCRA
uniref:Polyprotein protein n=1 Tax=Solanum tuberosum TaxID=4113 RepID=M1DU80_SOLTU